MLVSWEKRAGLHNEGEANEGKDVFQVLLADFWEELGLMFVHYVDNKDADPQALEGVATLLQVRFFFFFFCEFRELSMLAQRIQQINVAVTATHVLKSGQSD